MIWTIEYFVDKQFVKVVSEGDFNAGDHLEMIKDIISRPYWKPGMRAFFDNRNVNYSKADYREMDKAARNHIKYNDSIGNGKAAVLMKSIADYGIGRQFQLLSDEDISADIHVFKDEKKALAWLLKEQRNFSSH